MSENDRFCTACGAMLPEDSQFCPECGRPVNGGYNPQAAQYGSHSYSQAPNTREWGVSKLIMMYGIIGTLFGLYMLYTSLMFTEEAYLDYLFMLDQMVPGYSELMPEWSQSMQYTMVAGCAMGVASALAALGSYYFCWKGGPWKMALILCGAATALAAGVVLADTTGVLLVIVGAFVTYKLYQGREYFGEE